MSLFNEMQEAVASPHDYARGLKDNGKKIIGYFCSYVPEEIIHAAGLHPMRLFGNSSEIQQADAHLQSYSCSLVRGAMEQGLSGQVDYLTGTVFPHTCDSIQRLSDLWRLNTSFTFFADIVLPVKLDTHSARLYMIDVLSRFRHELADAFGVEITDAALSQSMDEYTTIRGSLKKLYELKSADPSLLRGSDLYTIVKASLFMDRTRLAAELPPLVEEVEGGAYRFDFAPEKRLVMIGSICDHPDIYTMIENLGGAVVYDDLCTGSRYFNGDYTRTDEPLTDIAEFYRTRLVCPAKFSDLDARGMALTRMATQHKVDGAIFLQLKFCDPHAFDYPYLKETLADAGVPSLLLEVEDRLPSEGQLSTRFETFIEML